jgi:acyl carrier protein
MTQEEVYKKVVSVLIEEFEIKGDDINLDANLFRDLELDSLDAIDLMVTLDKELDIEIKTEEMKDLHTIKDVCDFILTTSNNE